MPISERDRSSPPPASIDMVRVIRRSIRCFVFGVIGLVPLFGAGFAYQALRLRRAVSLDLEDGWKPPPVYLYWLLGTVALLAADAGIGVPGDVVVCVVILGIQSWQCYRCFDRASTPVWNPGQRELLWGVLLAQVGLALTLWTIVVLVLRVSKAIGV